MSEEKEMKNKKASNNLRVLIIEDDYRYAQQMIKGLEAAVPEFDLHTHIAHTASEALGESETMYDVVLLDLALSEYGERISGERILQELHQKSPATKFVIYSNYVPSSVEDTFKSSFLSQGADFIFKKPSVQDIVGSGLREIFKDFMPNPEQSEQKPDAKLILPVRQTITVLNDRLANMFRSDPQLLRNLDPFLFEQLVAELFEAEGYQIALTPPRADGGKDIYVSKTDSFAQIKFLVECKRYTPPNKVDVKIVRQLYGVVQHERASGGIIVTTSYFTKPATEFAGSVPYQLFLRDFDYLSNWIKKLK
jgi:ActR/RegA family two-component response regulator